MPSNPRRRGPRGTAEPGVTHRPVSPPAREPWLNEPEVTPDLERLARQGRGLEWMYPERDAISELLELFSQPLYASGMPENWVPLGRLYDELGYPQLGTPEAPVPGWLIDSLGEAEGMTDITDIAGYPGTPEAEEWAWDMDDPDALQRKTEPYFPPGSSLDEPSMNAQGGFWDWSGNWLSDINQFNPIEWIDTALQQGAQMPEMDVTKDPGLHSLPGLLMLLSRMVPV